jgi:hypothetical protein
MASRLVSRLRGRKEDLDENGTLVLITASILDYNLVRVYVVGGCCQ